MRTKYITIHLLFTALLSLASSYGADNILTNPGFESGTTGWSGFGCSFTTSPTIYHSGAKSGYATGRTATWNGISQSLLGKMTVGKTYTLTFWIRLENASDNGDTIGATISKTDSSGTHYYGVGSTTAFNNEWTPISGSYTLTVNGELTNLLLYFAKPAAGVNYYLDDVNLVLYEPPTPGTEASGQVNFTDVHQKLEGFGSDGAWYAGWLTVHPARNTIYNILFKQLGLDIYKVRNCYQVDSGAASYIADTKEIVQQAKSRNPALKVMLTAGSPPANLKSNNDANGFPQPGTLKKDANGVYIYQDYANWWATSLAAYESNSIHSDYISMQNEPDFEAPYQSCKFLPTETSDYAGYDKAFEAVYQKLHSQLGPNMPKLIAPDTMGFGGSKAYIHALIDANHVYGFSHHLYTDGDFNFPDSFVPAMQGYGQQYGYKPLFETEYANLNGNTADFTEGITNACHIYNCLVYEGVCSYFYWNLFWGDSGGLVTLIRPWGPNPTYTVNPAYYAVKHYAAFTDPNWYRVGASTNSNGLRISAFKSPDDSNLTVVIINVSPTVDINLSLLLNNYHSSASAIYQTKLNSNFAYIGTFNESSRLFLPHQSITTIRLGTPADCNAVWAQNFGMASDLNQDCYVDLKDLDIMADNWLRNNCGSSDNCSGADFAPVDGNVNLFDLTGFADQWMQCNNPTDANCS